MNSKGYKVDLHTHSILSYDGGLSESDYKTILEDKVIDYIAITDHNKIDFAQKMHQRYGDSVIVGEEIKTLDGEIIGLFLKEKIDPHQSALETCKAIKNQGGVVCVPHALERVRFGLSRASLEEAKEYIDIIEVYNARSLQKYLIPHIVELAEKYEFAKNSSSDAHCKWGIGTSFTVVEKKVTAKNLKDEIMQASLVKKSPPWWTYFCPGINKTRNLLHL